MLHRTYFKGPRNISWTFCAKHLNNIRWTLSECARILACILDRTDYSVETLLIAMQASWKDNYRAFRFFSHKPISVLNVKRSLAHCWHVAWSRCEFIYHSGDLKDSKRDQWFSKGKCIELNTLSVPENFDKRSVCIDGACVRPRACCSDNSLLLPSPPFMPLPCFCLSRDPSHCSWATLNHQCVHYASLTASQISSFKLQDLSALGSLVPCTGNSAETCACS